ncbi:MAG TPA: GtrA family protein [Amycolatopsis sp.]|nr:GtrA family protein [Amycolatopsis sp.]
MTLPRMIRFGLVGVLNTGTYYVLYLLFTQVLPYLAAHVCAFGISMVGSYFLNCYFTFRTRPTLKKFLLFPLSNATNFVVQSVGLYVLVSLLHVNHVVAPLLAAAVAIPITFVVAKLVLLGPDREPAAQQASPGVSR